MDNWEEIKLLIVKLVDWIQEVLNLIKNNV